MLLYLTVYIQNYISLFVKPYFLFDIKDIKPCPPNMFFADVNYAVKVFPYDERFPI